MKRYIRSNSSDDRSVHLSSGDIYFGKGAGKLDGLTYAAFLDDTWDDRNDILIYGDDKIAVKKCFDEFIRAFRTAPDIDDRYDSDSDELMRKLGEIALQNGVKFDIRYFDDGDDIDFDDREVVLITRQTGSWII